MFGRPGGGEGVMSASARGRGEDRVQGVRGAGSTDSPTLTDREFGQFRRLLYRITGISLSPAKKALVNGRLSKRIRRRGVSSYGEYFRLLSDDSERAELQIAVDLLTTNETHFFREPAHFEVLRTEALRVDALRTGTARTTFRVWSAACSSGEEPCSIAMVLADVLGRRPWEILGSDISSRVLERARGGRYPVERAREIPPRYLSAYCLRGVRSHAGEMLIRRELRDRVQIRQVNLNAGLPSLGEFDVIFLRNVMIYFDMETKRQVVRRVAARLRRGGCLIVGHSESLNGIDERLKTERPSVYRNE